MMGTLSGRLDSWLLAEGVETRAELDCLVRLGVPLVQGYHLARPGAAWPTVDTDTSLHLLTSGQRSQGTTLRGLLEQAVTAESVEQARAWFEIDAVEQVVVLDQNSYPVHSLAASGLVRTLNESLRFNVDTDVTTAAYRAVARVAGARGEPLICTDNAGRFVGVVRMESIVKSLAAASTRDPQSLPH